MKVSRHVPTRVLTANPPSEWVRSAGFTCGNSNPEGTAGPRPRPEGRPSRSPDCSPGVGNRGRRLPRHFPVTCIFSKRATITAEAIKRRVPAAAPCSQGHGHGHGAGLSGGAEAVAVAVFPGTSTQQPPTVRTKPGAPRGPSRLPSRSEGWRGSKRCPYQLRPTVTAFRLFYCSLPGAARPAGLAGSFRRGARGVGVQRGSTSFSFQRARRSI